MLMEQKKMSQRGWHTVTAGRQGEDMGWKNWAGPNHLCEAQLSLAHSKPLITGPMTVIDI